MSQKRLLASLCLPVPPIARLSVQIITLAPTGRILLKFNIGGSY